MENLVENRQEILKDGQEQCTVHTSQGRKCCNVKLNKRDEIKKGEIIDADNYVIQQGNC